MTAPNCSAGVPKFCSMTISAEVRQFACLNPSPLAGASGSDHLGDGPLPDAGDSAKLSGVSGPADPEAGMAKRFHYRPAQPVRDRGRTPVRQSGEHRDGEQCDGGELYIGANGQEHD